MTNTHSKYLTSARSVGRDDLQWVLARTNPVDIHRLLQCIELVLSAGRIAAGGSSRAIDLRSEDPTSRFKLIGLFIQRRAAHWSTSALTESLAALKDLAWLRGKLRAHAAHAAHAAAPLPICASSLEPQIPTEGNPVFRGNAERKAVSLVYRLSVGRCPNEAEIDIWIENFRNGVSFSDFLISMYESGEAQHFRATSNPISYVPDGEFIQILYEGVLGRGCTPREVDEWRQQLQSGSIDRNTVLRNIFSDCTAQLRTNSVEVKPDADGLSCHIMGTNRTLSIAEWRKRKRDLKLTPAGEAHSSKVSHARFHIMSPVGTPLVSAIASLYRGERYIERFMDNIVSQSCFRDHCELIIVDADSPENESKVIERYCREFDNIVYHRVNYRIGIYDAWNVGVKMARGQYCTNTNLDDLRRHDSLELQAATLDNLPFVDVVYQDFLYTLEPDLCIEEISDFNYVSDLPMVNAANMMYFNSPHNAPMWRKRLHDQLGLFDIHYKSAGDYEFWMRCLEAGKVFYKLNDPHAVYYQNPDGISTRPGSRGIEEAKLILKTYGRRLVSQYLIMPEADFLHHLTQRSGPYSQFTSRYAATQAALRSASMRHRAKSRMMAGYGNQYSGVES